MTRKNQANFKVQASRDGHEFHEAWTARKALQLVFPADDFIGMSVEGLSPKDEKKAAPASVEVADLVLYHGKSPDFASARVVAVLQFKYSIRNRHKPVRVSDAKETIKKFAASYLDHKKRYGAKSVSKKLLFEFVTNRPIDDALQEAIKKTANGARLSQKAKAQADQFKAASGLTGKDLNEFSGKAYFTGLTGSLQDSKSDLSRTLADWSATSTDALAQARLGKLRDLVREKAGTKGAGRNIIVRTDVFAALGISGIEELLPSPESFPDVGKVVQREQLDAALKSLSKAKKPFLVHADGGVGKTVFIQSLAKSVSESHRAILFDCFGGGGYRAPEDARHLPRKGLVHIANLLASEGICDPLLPGHDNADEIIGHFRKRLTQAVKTLRRASPKMRLIIFLDAIDNAAIQAKDRNEDSFPLLLLRSWRVSGPVDGVQLVVSSRTEPERRDLAVGNVPCEELSLQPFSRNEATQYLKARVRNATKTEIEVAYARSQGNPRILKHLAEGDRGLLEESEIDRKILLDDLIMSRITDALEEASTHGYSDETIKAFLAGLAVLPPPVPVREYADAQGISHAAIQSFATDLYPLLEKTKQGLVFRDEPTETLVRNKYADDPATLRRIADNLFKKQSESIYAASALPGLLQKIDAGDLLFKLALDDRFPAAITSEVGKREIRYARLKAAARFAASKDDFNQLVHLLVEMSAIAAVKQRGTNYIKDNPALVVASEDVDAMRRLFELRAAWPGMRHARLAIANVLSNDVDEAQRHVIRAIEWINHAWRQDRETRHERQGPEILDLVSVPLCRIVEGRPKNAVRALNTLTDWAAFEVTDKLLSMLNQAERAGVTTATHVQEFQSEVTSKPGVLAAILSFNPVRSASSKKLVKKLAAACRRTGLIKRRSEFTSSKDMHEVDGGLEKAAAIAILNGLHREAAEILSSIRMDRPSSWTYTDHFSDGSSGAFIRRAVLDAVAAKKSLIDSDVLPRELGDIAKSIDRSIAGESFRKAVQHGLEAQYKAQPPGEDEKKKIGHEDKRRMEVFLNQRMERLLRIARCFEDALSAAPGRADRPFVRLLDAWSDLANKHSEYTDRQNGQMFFDMLGRSLLMFCLQVRPDLKAAFVKTAVSRIEASPSTFASNLIDIIGILARRPAWHASIDAASIKVRSLIELEDDVGHRGSMFAQLAQAMLPASRSEASAYFTLGLKEVDAFGSGDHYYTNDLLLFAASLKGDELSAQDSHTLSNFCEMNMASEERKFPWFSFAKGMASAAGPRILAKLGRWDDRDKISLAYTLLPYLTALIERRKISPEVALGLMQLADAAELYVCGTGTFATVLHGNAYPNEKLLLQELIRQFSGNNPGIPPRSTTDELQKLAAEVFGPSSPEAIHLSAAAPHYSMLIDEQNDHRNYYPQDKRRSERNLDKEKEAKRKILKAVARRTEPAKEVSMLKAIDALNKIDSAYDVKDDFLDAIRNKVAFADRATYIRIVANLDSFYYYWRLQELARCREQWGASSPGLSQIFRQLAIPFIQVNFDKFIHDEILSGSMLKEVSDFTGVAYPELAAELIKVLAKSNESYAAAIWMALATIVNERAQPGEAQAALHRLLTGSTVRLTAGVTDGPFRAGLYPANAEAEIAAGLVWLKLGSPSALDRWRAAHAVRCFARMDRWDVIDAIVARWNKTTADEFQAPELTFYFLHARLWLLIALARLAFDEPAAVAKYEAVLMAIVKDAQQPHVLMRQFAADALKTCLSTGSLRLSAADSAMVASVNSSPFPLVKYERDTARAYRGVRPKTRVRPTNYFGLEYDFEKHDVSNLATAFGLAPSEVADSITDWVRRFDAGVRGMYEDGGRSERSSRGGVGLVSHFHVYGQYLGWNCICFAAAGLLVKYPVHEGYFDADSWNEWLKRRLLTRSDGLWLADGMDETPLDTQVNLLEKGDEGLVLTGDRAKLLRLAGIDKKPGKRLIVEGNWKSSDGIEVSVSSALVPKREARKFATELSKAEPFFAWLPTLEARGGSGEYEPNDKDGCESWIVCPSADIRLDEDDPLGAHSAMRRPYFKEEIRTLNSLASTDPFNRAWIDSEGTTVARAEAWGREFKYRENGSQTGERLVCSLDFLLKVLAQKQASLVLLISAQQYIERAPKSEGHFANSAAVVVITSSARLTYFPGLINHVLQPRH
jgi:hypothetical protein